VGTEYIHKFEFPPSIKFQTLSSHQEKTCFTTTPHSIAPTFLATMSLLTIPMGFYSEYFLQKESFNL
jgi:hypothetical protein